MRRFGPASSVGPIAIIATSGLAGVGTGGARTISNRERDEVERE